MRYYLILACTLWLTACGKATLQEQQAYVFGTRVEVIVVSDQPELGRQAISAVLQEFDRLHRNFHAWQPSELQQLNLAISAGAPQQVSPELADYLREAQELSEQGHYLFDPGIGQLIKLWGFQADEFKAELPAEDEIKAWLKAKPSIADLVIKENTVSSKNRHVALDFGGYLKGVALDHAAAILRSQGINNALINIGGNVIALGDKAGRKWKVGIQHPRQPGPLATVELADGEAIGTSGDYQRFFELDGKRYPHLLDPRSGYPANHTQSVTILIPASSNSGNKAGTLSDANSKPIFIAGPEAWRNIARQLNLEMVMRVDSEGQIQLTQALSERIQLIGQQTMLTVVP